MSKDAGQLQQNEFHHAIDMLQPLVATEELDAMQPLGNGAVYTTSVTLWMLTLQRLGQGKTLEGVIKEVLSHHRELLPQNQRVQQGTLSFSSGAYSAARQRLEEETVEWCREMLAHSPLALRCLKSAMNADCDGQAGLQELAGNATLLYYMTEEGQEGRNAFNEKRKPDFGQYPKRP